MDLVTDLQRHRLMAVLRGMARGATPDDVDALVLIGLAVGLEMAARHPEAAARILVELAPPLDTIDHWLDWVVVGNAEPDPELPVN